MARALVRHAAPYVLSSEDGAAERLRPAIVTPRHAWRRAGVLLMAAGSCGLDRVAPHLAQKQGVLTQAHHQHDQENGCSKHMELTIPRGKNGASLEETRRHRILAVSGAHPGRARRRAEFRRAVPKIPHRMRVQAIVNNLGDPAAQAPAGRPPSNQMSDIRRRTTRSSSRPGPARARPRRAAEARTPT